MPRVALASKCWVQAFIKRALPLALISSLIAPLCLADAFGRFGFVQVLDLPGLRVSRQGVQAKSANATLLAFSNPSRSWQATITSETGQTVALDSNPHSPHKAAASLFATGASLYFSDGCEFRIAAKGTPFLTWKEGSVAPGIPTPKLNWALLSFSDAQPPVLLVLPKDIKESFRVEGSPGAWVLRTDDFAGWMRIEYPFGTRDMATPTVGDLGVMEKDFEGNIEFCTAPIPKLLVLDLTADDDGISATWSFTGPIVVPGAVAFASTGGYPIELNSGYRPTGAVTEEGPVLAMIGNKLKVRFPCKRVGPGRGIAFEDSSRIRPGTVAAIDAPSVINLALEAARGDRDPTTVAMAQDATQTFLSGAEFAMEIWSGQTVSYTSQNNGLDLTAAYGLLAQAMELGSVRPATNPFLTSVFWRTDWLSWMPYSPEFGRDQDRRAAAYAAVASTMNPSVEARLEGAMLEAGLSAERVRENRLRALGKNPPKLVEPLPGVRHALFGTRFDSGITDCSLLLGGMRVLSDLPVVARRDAGTAVLLVPAPSAKPFRLTLSVPPGTEFLADENVTALSATPGPDNTLELLISPAGPGNCMLRLKTNMDALASGTTLPLYSEIRD